MTLARLRAAAVLGLLALPISCDTNVNDGDGDTTITTLVSLSSAGVQAFGTTGLLSNNAAVSGNGQFVAFVSSAPNLVAGKVTTTRDVFRRDLLSGLTVRVSLDSGGNDANGDCYAPSISFDGSRIAFESTATDLDPLDNTLAAASIYVWQEGGVPGLGTVALVSQSSVGVNGDGSSTNPAISADGRSVAFASTATVLDAAAGGSTYNNIFVRRLGDFPGTPNTTALVSRISGVAGLMGGALSIAASISSDGRYIAFRSDATNLDSALADSNGFRDIYRRDTGGTFATIRVSVPAAGGQANGHSDAPSISDDGSGVAFQTQATNFVPGDINAAADVYVKNLLDGEVVLASRSDDGSISTGGALPRISGNGRYVAFSAPGILLPSDTNGFQDVYRFGIDDGAVIRVSLGPQGRQADNASSVPSISTDGSSVAFESDAANLVDGDGNSNRDVFVRRDIR